MDIILHLGAHRCGSTTLQQFLQRNAPALGDAGIAVWTPDRTRAGLMAGLIQRPQDVTEQIERRGARSVGLIRVEMSRLARAGTRAVILSEENMIGAVRNNLRESRLYPLADERLLRFRPALRPDLTGGRLRIGVAIRSYETFWASSLAFGLAQGHRLPSMAMLDRLVTQPRRWRDLIADIAGILPGAAITVWPFERFAARPEAQLGLLLPGAAAGLRLTGLRERSNVSPDRDKLRAFLRLRGDDAGRATIPPGPGRWMPFAPDQVAALRDMYRADLAWLMAGADGLAQCAGAQGLSRRNDDGADDARGTAARRPETASPPLTGIMEGTAGFDGASAHRPPDRGQMDGGQEYGRQDIMV